MHQPAATSWRLQRARTLAGVLLLALALGSIPLALGLRVDNRLERWIETDETAAAEYAAFRQTFGTDEFVVAAYTGAAVFDVAALDIQIAVLESLEALGGVADVLSIAGVYRDRFGSEDAEAFRREVTGTPFYRGFLYEDAPEVGAYFIDVGASPGAEGRAELVEAVRHAIAPLQAAGFTTHVVGSPVLNVELDRLSETESLRSFPIALLCAVGVLLLLFRDVKATLAAVLCATVTMLLALGLIAVSGHPLNMVTSVLPTLLWALSLAGVIHLVRQYQVYRAAQGANASMDAALRDTFRPCLLAACTTAAGFLSLCTAGMAPVRELGVFAALGVMLGLVVNMTLGPVLLRWLRVGGVKRLDESRHARLMRLYRWPMRARRVVLAVSVLLFAMGVVAMLRVRVEANPLNFLPADSPLVRDYRFVAEHLTGLYTVELVIDAGQDWLAPEVVEVIERTATELGNAPGIARVLSPLDVLKKLRQWDAGAYGLPETRAASEQLLGMLDADGEAQLRRLVSADGRQIRLSLLVNVMGSEKFYGVMAGAEAALRTLPAPMSGSVTGIVPQLVGAQMSLVKTQIRSFSTAFIVVFACIWIGLRSLRLTLISIPPNVLPIPMTLALMVWLDIPLDPGTVMAASIALGIAVDDTVHMLSTYQMLREAGLGNREAISTVLEKVAPAMSIMTVTVAIGFLVLTRSAFVPIAYFGLLAAFAMVVAIVADFFIVPALLSYGREGKS